MIKLTLSEILQKNTELMSVLDGSKYDIGIISNVTLSPINDILECTLRLENINAYVELGNYDSIISDCKNFSQKNAVIVFWELTNLVADFEISVNRMNENQVNQLIERFEDEIKFVINELKDVPLVLWNKFSASLNSFNPLSDSINKIRISDRLNNVLQNHKTPNMVLVDLEKIFLEHGINKVFDARLFHSSKAPYTTLFHKDYANKILPAIFAATGKTKKVLVLDCDNTLWGGVIGEDGISSIDIDVSSKKGEIFSFIHEKILDLKNKGVMLAICSKNNYQDVEEVFNNHKKFALQISDFSALRINWINKMENIKSIAEELNVGLDSFVFLDDSMFEIDNIKQALPEVSCFIVPKNLSDYPKLFDSLEKLFFSIGATKEDTERTKMYIQESKRKKELLKWKSQDDYLESLELEVTILNKKTLTVPRAAQLTQKTNQFNLTTKRYTEVEIQNFIKSKEFFIRSFLVKDKFGEYGETGLIIIKKDIKNQSLHIDTLLMSCRVIGRKIEMFFIDHIIKEFINSSFKTIHGKYTKTAKNDQVKNFYESINFECSESNKNEKYYVLDLDNYNAIEGNFINIEECYE